MLDLSEKYHPTHREFLVSTASAVAVGAMLSPLARPVQGARASPPEPRPATPTSGIPSHRALPAPGVPRYTDKPGYAAGDMLTGNVRSTEPCELEVARLWKDIDSPARDEVLQTQDDPSRSTAGSSGKLPPCREGPGRQASRRAYAGMTFQSSDCA